MLLLGGESANILSLTCDVIVDGFKQLLSSDYGTLLCVCVSVPCWCLEMKPEKRPSNRDVLL